MLGFDGDYTPGAYNFKIQDALAGAASVPYSKDNSALSGADRAGGATQFTVTSPTPILHLAVFRLREVSTRHTGSLFVWPIYSPVTSCYPPVTP